MKLPLFELYKPIHHLKPSDHHDHTWLHEVRRLRSHVLFANGRRPAFGPGGHHYGDPCPRDDHSFHVTVRVGDRLVGCTRAMPLCNDKNNAVLDDVMGHGELDRSLATLQVKRDRCIEISRLILDTEYRASNLARKLVASACAIGWQLGASMIVAGSGTGDYQDRFIARLGARPLPHTDLVPAHAFNDHIRPMYAWTRGRDHTFVAVVQQMHDYFFGRQGMVPQMAVAS